MRLFGKFEERDIKHDPSRYERTAFSCYIGVNTDLLMEQFEKDRRWNPSLPHWYRRVSTGCQKTVHANIM